MGNLMMNWVNQSEKEEIFGRNVTKKFQKVKPFTKRDETNKGRIPFVKGSDMKRQDSIYMKSCQQCQRYNAIDEALFKELQNMDAVL